MEIRRSAAAGTLESSDILVTVEPCMKGIKIELRSPVYVQFGQSILDSISGVLNELGVENAEIHADDRGALDCTIKARVETAVRRAAAEDDR